MTASGPAGFRTDIQALRAGAVLLVLVFHLWPAVLRGGYVGVDVFFVISGYLITGQLFREQRTHGRVRLATFYERRMRRLLPAASLTLVSVAAGALLWLPRALWETTAQEIIASTFYVENLLLVQKSVDYLAQDAAPSAVQHYWSLSVEEQFYIFWPLLLMAVGAFARRRAAANLGTWLRVALGSVCLTSLATSIYYARTDPAPGYFLTTTRVWELGIGGLLALGRDDFVMPRRIGSPMAWIGIIAIGVSAWSYSVTTPFPGYLALLPTCGAAFVIAARPSEDTWLGKLLKLPTLQYIGGISYSLYLWHWPVIVLYPSIFGRKVELFSDGVTAAAFSFLFAHLSKQFVEDRFRHPSPEGTRWYKNRGFALGAATTTLAAMGAVVLYRSMPSSGADVQLSDSARKYPGAEAFVHGAPVETVKNILPLPELAKADRGTAYGSPSAKRCIAVATSTELEICSYGPKRPSFHVTLIGDSHAVHWLPAFEQLANVNGWRVSGLTKDSCALTDIMLSYGARAAVRRPYEECRVWSEKVMAWLLKERPDLVILSMSSHHRTLDLAIEEARLPIAQGIVRVRKKLEAAGIRVGAIKETPWQIMDVPVCMSKPGAKVQDCSGKLGTTIPQGALGVASKLDPALTLLNFDDAFCRDDLCPAVVGNVLVYRDSHHMTATYAKTLARVLDERLKAAFPDAD